MNANEIDRLISRLRNPRTPNYFQKHIGICYAYKLEFGADTVGAFRDRLFPYKKIALGKFAGKSGGHKSARATYYWWDRDLQGTDTRIKFLNHIKSTLQ